MIYDNRILEGRGFYCWIPAKAGRGIRMNKAKISPSMMCADIGALSRTLEVFKKNQIEYLHIDIMDGSFVPNITMGTDYCRQLRRLTDIPLDLHLMVENPQEKLEWFDIGPGDIVSVHYEAACHLQRTLTCLKERGTAVFVALNPATSVELLRYVLDDLDGVLLMTVNPGFAGQKAIPATIEKIRDTRQMLVRTGHPDMWIEVDGNVSPENAVKMRSAGADIFVGGTASLFRNGQVTDQSIQALREAIRRGEQ